PCRFPRLGRWYCCGPCAFGGAPCTVGGFARRHASTTAHRTGQGSHPAISCLFRCRLSKRFEISLLTPLVALSRALQNDVHSWSSTESRMFRWVTGPSKHRSPLHAFQPQRKKRTATTSRKTLAPISSMAPPGRGDRTPHGRDRDHRHHRQCRLRRG